MLITNVRPWGGNAVDIEIREGRIVNPSILAFQGRGAAYPHHLA